MKHFSRNVTCTLGVVALGSATLLGQNLLGQQAAPPARPFGSAPAAVAPLGQPASGNFTPSSGFSSAVNPATATSTGQPVRRGEVLVPHGLVTAIDDVRVPASDAGSLTKLYVKGGELVNAAVVLGEIDNRDTVAKQRIAQGELDAAKAQAASTAEIEAAEKGRDVALEEYKQQQAIRDRQPGAVSIMELNRAKFQWERALAQIAVAKTENNIAGLTAVMKQAQLDATAIELTKKQIQAPINGQIVEVYKHVGEWVQPGDPVLRLVRLDRVRVEGFVYAAEAGRSEVEGRPVTVVVYLPGDKQVTVQGRVDFASPLIEGSGRNRQYRIWAEVENQFVDGHFVIQPGASAELRVDLLAAKLPAPERETPPMPTPAIPAAPVAAPASPAFGARAEETPANETAVENIVENASPATSVESLKPEAPAAEAPASDEPTASAQPAPARPVPAPAAPAANARPSLNGPAATRPSNAPATKAAPRATTPNAAAPASSTPRAAAPTRPASPAPANPRPAIGGMADPGTSPAVPQRPQQPR